jgi:hypothetical protein
MFTPSLNQFAKDNTKVLYAILLLWDRAFNWIQPMLRTAREDLPPSELQSFIAFRNVLKKMFGNFDAEVAVERKLEKLQ